MDIQTQLEIGRNAEQFLVYLSQFPYFGELIERVKLTYANRILSLRPDDTEKFRVLKERMDVWEEIMEAVKGDIALGAEALKKIEGVDKQKGLL
jgi:hypothetical protein